MNFTLDSSAIYRRSRIITVPSICQDTFPRVIVEALCSETPVIASGTGGMRDAGGDAAFYEAVERDPTNPEQFIPERWIRKIHELDDAARYARAREVARVHIAAFEENLRDSMKRLVHSMGS